MLINYCTCNKLDYKVSKIFQSATSEIPPSKDFADTDTNFAYFETYSLLFAYFETLIAYFEGINGTNAAGGGGGNGTLKACF